MQQIADKVHVHVTTVSRAVDDKWIQTPRGIFPLKRFFCGGTVSAQGEEVAWDNVRRKLQEIIDHENKQNPLSDDELVKELGKAGLTVARRTVTKYRKSMNIPSSRQRRDWSLGTEPPGEEEDETDSSGAAEGEIAVAAHEVPATPSGPATDAQVPHAPVAETPVEPPPPLGRLVAPDQAALGGADSGTPAAEQLLAAQRHFYSCALFAGCHRARTLRCGCAHKKGRSQDRPGDDLWLRLSRSMQAALGPAGRFELARHQRGRQGFCRRRRAMPEASLRVPRAR